MGERNLARLAETEFDRHGDYDSLFYGEKWWSNGTLADRSARLATGLSDLGVRPGDRVVVLMANCPEVLISYRACWRAGFVITPLIFLVTQDELRHVLIDSAAVAVITTTEFLGKVHAAVRGAPSVRSIVVAGDAPDSAHVLEFAEVAAADPGSIVDRADDDLAALLYTGGTTGRAKGVPLSHANLWWCGKASALNSAGAGLGSTLVPLPLSHVYGLLVTCTALHQPDPHRLVLMRWFDPVAWLDLAQQHRVRRAVLVPSMIQMLLSRPLERADLSALAAVSSGAAPLAEETRQEFEARVPSARIYEGYGCTESGALIAGNPLTARRVGSVGKPVDGCEVTIRNESDTALPAGEDGEICVRSPGVMAGYWHAPHATEVALAGGWLHTGDIGHLDTDGYLYVVDRKKDLIIRGGFNVYPRDVEDVLLDHPAVALAGVVGRPDDRLGEEVVAFVSLRPNANATADELIEHARSRLAATKYPREVRIVAEVPLTSVGKLDRKRLRAQVRHSG